jgi:hypothetical protein
MNVYYGCAQYSLTQAPPPLDGNWNTAANWFSTLGTPACGCGCPIPATPLGRVPAPGDSVVLVGNATVAADNVISVGPTSGWAGVISWYVNGTTLQQNAPVTISVGNYSGVVTLGESAAPSSLLGFNHVFFGISGGNFSNTVNVEYSLNVSNSFALIPLISGGNFTGLVTRTAPAGPHYYSLSIIAGGTYSPTVSVPYQKPNSIVVADYPEDPGFQVGGGTFSPVITLTGLPDILGAGIPA